MLCACNTVSAGYPLPINTALPKVIEPLRVSHGLAPLYSGSFGIELRNPNVEISFIKNNVNDMSITLFTKRSLSHVTITLYYLNGPPLGKQVPVIFNTSLPYPIITRGAEKLVVDGDIDTWIQELCPVD
jgi:hypothetical protein